MTRNSGPPGHLSASDGIVGRGFDNVFVTSSSRTANARSPQHRTSGQIFTLPTSTNNTSYRFANYTAQNIGKKTVQDSDQATDRDTKRRRVNPKKSDEPVSDSYEKGNTERAYTFPIEVWLNIFEHAGLKVLVNAMRINPEVRQLLIERDSVWKNCREKQYGTTAPSPPLGMSEREFAMLIVGRGCMTNTCPCDATDKVYWAFRSRLCHDCLMGKVVKLDDLPIDFKNNPQKQALLHCIQAGNNQGGKYSGCRAPLPNSDDWPLAVNINKLLFYREDVARIEKEYEDMVRQGVAQDEIQIHCRERRREAVKYARTIKIIGDWEAALLLEKKCWRNDRREYFREQAGLLDPSISFEALEHMYPFRMTLDSNREPKYGQFESLRRKIVGLKVEADRIVEVDEITNRTTFDLTNRTTDPRIKTYNDLDAHRSTRESPEQQAVKKFAAKILDDLRREDIQDCDLVLILLKTVKDNWKSTTIQGILATGVVGPYELTLDDAKMILEQVVQTPQITKNHLKAPIILEKFKCPACTRHDCKSRYPFVALFEHVYKKHAQYASDYSKELRRPFSKDKQHSFPWYTTYWPKNLPILADHQSANSTTNAMNWDFHTAHEYQQAPKPVNISAFEDCKVNPAVGIKTDDFNDNLDYAAAKLAHTLLPQELHTILAIRYAFECYTIENPSAVDTPPLDLLEAASDHLARAAGEHKITLRWPCGICAMDGTVSRSSQWCRVPRAFRDLLNHFSETHARTTATNVPSLWLDLNDDDAAGIFALPSPSQIREQLNIADEDLEARKKDEALKQQKRRSDPKKKSSDKANVVLSAPSGWKVFYELWDKEEEQEGLFIPE